jgi:hypothetical protein
MRIANLEPMLSAVLVLGSMLSGCGASPGSQIDETSTSSAALVGTTEPAANQILVCIDANFGGVCLLLGVGFSPYSVGVPNDSMSSIKVGSAVRVTLCGNGIYGGTCETLPAGARVTNLGTEPVGNDSVSSLRVVDASTPECRFGAAPPPGWAFFFRDGGYNGDCAAHQIGEYPTSEDIGLANDSISSLRVGATPIPGKELRANFWIDSNFRGLASFGGFRGDVSYVGDWNDSVSSLSVTTYP